MFDRGEILGTHTKINVFAESSLYSPYSLKLVNIHCNHLMLRISSPASKINLLTFLSATLDFLKQSPLSGLIHRPAGGGGGGPSWGSEAASLTIR